MKKIITSVIVLLSAISLMFMAPVSITVAKNKSIDPIPEQSGDYNDPENPGIRVKVFVHSPKQKTSNNLSSACSLDLPSTAVTGSTDWKLSPKTWFYKINKASIPSSVGGTNIENIAVSGFNNWSNSITSSIKPIFSYSGTTSINKSRYDGQNILAWNRLSGGTLGITYVRYYVSTGQVVDVDTLLNQRYSWTVNTCSTFAYDVADILVHEQGHWLGLDDHYTSDYINNTMYGSATTSENKKVTLTEGDIRGLNFIYP